MEEKAKLVARIASLEGEKELLEKTQSLKMELAEEKAKSASAQHAHDMFVQGLEGRFRMKGTPPSADI